jgi:hypothetical protein
MIKITRNQAKKVKSSRININSFEEKATIVYNTIVKSQIEYANSSDLNIIKKKFKIATTPFNYYCRL